MREVEFDKDAYPYAATIIGSGWVVLYMPTQEIMRRFPVRDELLYMEKPASEQSREFARKLNVEYWRERGGK